MKTYVMHTDPGHGWLAVPIRELVELGIDRKISPYSYMNNRTAYLEEDMDLAVFFEAYSAKYGVTPTLRESYREHTPIRRYARYTV